MTGRSTAVAGVVGPLAFVGAWVTGAFVADDLSPVHDAISRLAAVAAPTRAVMTAGFVTFGIALPMYATVLRRSVGGAAWATAAATGVCTLAVAAAPLDQSVTVDRLHGLAAGLGYLTLAVTPLLAAAPLRRQRRRRLARWGVAAGGVSGASLILSLTTLPTGLFQRIGLTAADAWIVASALTLRGDDAVVTRR